jgi:hypothetical protein
MICKERADSSARPFFVFPFGGKSAPNVAFRLVFVQNLTDLDVEGIVTLPQPLCQCFVNGRLGDAEVFGSGADSGTGLNHVHSQFAGTLFDVLGHMIPPKLCATKENLCTYGGKYVSLTYAAIKSKM